MFDFTLHAGTRYHFLFIGMSLLFFCLLGFNKKNKKIGEKMQNLIIIFFPLLLAFQILYMFLLDISVHCVLIKYAYI
jgi:hypothetical protein